MNIIEFTAGKRIDVQVIGHSPFSRLTYKLSEDQKVFMGQIVKVPFNRKELIAIVIGEGNTDIADDKLKSPTDIIDFLPPIQPQMISFLTWMSDWCVAPSRNVFRLLLSTPQALERPKAEKYVYLNPQAPKIRQTEARKKVLSLLQQQSLWKISDLQSESGVSGQVITSMIKQDILQEVTKEPQNFEATFDIAKADHAPFKLSEAQQKAANNLIRAMQQQAFSVTLLDGVPGSGKTEVYFEMIAQAIAQGKQALVMLPEIGLTSQWLDRCQRRFGAKPAIWHSALTPAQRRDTWRAIALNQVQIVAGARSALFLPFQDLACIIVDEEHDSSYKQEDIIVYHGRDMAIMRAKKEQCPIVLASATPSLESWVNQQQGKYQYIELPNRFGGQLLPDIHLIDLKEEPPEKHQWLSPVLIKAIKETLQRGEQSLLFLNRRGYAPSTFCKSCETSIECPHCSISLVEHKRDNRLYCHYCGYNIALLKSCPNCKEENSFIPLGPGIERIAEEARHYFPNANIEQASSDMFDTHQDAADFIRRVEQNKVDIIVGTQIISRGYHFDNLTLVGIIDADLGLNGDDLRANEHTWQMLWQTAGRAGRSKKPGHVYLQTNIPAHPVIKTLCNNDRFAFMHMEAKLREQAGMPPFGRLAALIVSDTDEQRLLQTCYHLKQHIPKNNQIQVIGEAKPAMEKLRSRFRRRFLIMSNKNVILQPFIHQWLTKVRIPSQIRIKIDIDPYNFM